MKGDVLIRRLLMFHVDDHEASTRATGVSAREEKLARGGESTGRLSNPYLLG
jgi:hypothetical protein